MPPPDKKTGAASLVVLVHSETRAFADPTDHILFWNTNRCSVSATNSCKKDASLISSGVNWRRTSIERKSAGTSCFVPEKAETRCSVLRTAVDRKATSRGGEGRGGLCLSSLRTTANYYRNSPRQAY